MPKGIVTKDGSPHVAFWWWLHYIVQMIKCSFYTICKKCPQEHIWYTCISIEAERLLRQTFSPLMHFSKKLCLARVRARVQA